MKAKKLISVLLLLTMLLSLAIPTAFADKKEAKEIHIKDAEGLIKLSTDCVLDTYSKGLTVILDNDIDLGGVEFYPIPTFSGIFDGAGHRIINMKTATNGSNQGLFRYIQKEGTVKNLELKGEVTPDGSKNQVGGIAGVNYGLISDCSFEGRVSGNAHTGGICGDNQGTVKSCISYGSVDGKQGVGGIVGKNTGIIMGCRNNAKVNTSINEKGLELDKLNLMDVTSLDLKNAEDPDVVTDSGGIAGFSSGLISACVNRGTVGYQHYGYNLGGIAGRQSGFIEKCNNHGKIFGRKDAGGIVGQMEPYLRVKNSVNLAGEIYALHDAVSSALNNVGDMSYYMRDSLENIRMDAESMLDKMEQNSGKQDNNENANNAASFDKDYRPVNISSVSPEINPEQLQGNTNAASPDSTVDPNEPNTWEPNVDMGFNMDDYRDYLDSMADEMHYLNSSMGESAEYMTEDLKRASAQLSHIIMIMANILSGGDRTVIEDISEKLGLDDIEGRVDGCTNFGHIEADKNVGGIAGMMGVEYDFDLEGSLSEIFNRSNMLTATYQSKCVSSRNINEGSVEGKKENIGGICGFEEIGSIQQCEGYGSVKSVEGGCVGGIAGKSAADINTCYAMCNLDGGTNIGGIAGYGTKIKNCGSLVGIVDMTNPCCGAIAGWADINAEGNIENNLYVHKLLGAIDGISYEGKAVSAEYEDFLKTEGLPERFKSLNISYVADGKEIKRLEFDYGGTIDQSQIPPVPEKAGYTGKWSDYDYSELYFSDTVEAVYTSRQAAIASELHREDSPMSIVLLEGDFPEKSEVLLNEYTGQGPVNTEGEVLEKWLMRIEEAGEVPEGRYTVRYAPPETKGNVSVYVYDGESWSKVRTGRNGSYLTFEASGEELVFCSAATEKGGIMGTIIGIAAILLAALILIIVVKKLKKKKCVSAVPGEKAPEAEQKESKAAEEVKKE